jgi:hypothetical protein
VKQFLNCTIPELANIKVGSLRGTKEELSTTLCPLRSKKSKYVERISFKDTMMSDPYGIDTKICIGLSPPPQAVHALFLLNKKGQMHLHLTL